MASRQLRAASACSQPAKPRLAAVLCPQLLQRGTATATPCGCCRHPSLPSPDRSYPATASPHTRGAAGILISGLGPCSSTLQVLVLAPGVLPRARAWVGAMRPAPALPSALAAGPRCFAIPSPPLPTPSHQLWKLPGVGRALQGRQSRVTVWEMSQVPAAPAATPHQCSQPRRVGQHRWMSAGLARESFWEKTWQAGRLLKSCQNSTGES